ncbi:MAG: WecB/TagA/CpsF family glycosyltransferase [Alphaproteobacteria bacterium]|nr:WecB/TagA/CpsF family glycosyltransferase [Alphaproteobacteria bacterium]MCB9697354.1 WecB/TagA/CpsF family glycosyltransferase [Alphaproteobacteria bacterium]
MRRVDLGGCAIDAGAFDELVERLAADVEAGGPHHHVSMNAAKWVALLHDESLREAVREATSVGADGAPVARAVRSPRVPGIELAEALLRLAPERGWRVALVGARPDVVTSVATLLRERGVDVVLARDGMFAEDEERAAAAQVAESRAQLVLLALGTPKAELFARRWGPAMGAGLVMGVGGSFDVWSGRERRAPAWALASGLEGAWRWLGAPRARFGRAVLGPALFLLHRARGTRIPFSADRPPPR